MFSFLYNVIVSPIELVVEFVFGLMFRMLGQGETNQGLAVVGVSLAISFLTLPLYRRADIVQQHERETRMRMSVMLNRIRAVFSGDERFMMIQAYYREQGYSPIHALKGSVSLLLEIPFFIAAYHFLSNLEILNGAPFGIIADLGKPDRLIGFGGHSINLLPILMTFINCVSAAVYFRGFALKDKLQTYGLALVFLVLLYNSPSGLVVYWTCNNIFSLAKNIFYNLRNPRTVFSVVCALSGTIFAVCATLSGVLNSRKKYVAVFLFMACSFIPLVCLKIKKKPAAKRKEAGVPVSMPVFFVSAFVLSVLLGVLIPSGVIESSPAEFIDVGDFRNPLHFLRFSLAYALGFFVLWAGIVFAIMGKTGQNRFSAVFCAISVVFIVDYMCFSRNLGLLSSYLVFDNDPEFPKLGVILNLFVVALLFGGVMFMCRFRRGVVAATYVSVMLLFSVSVLSFVNVHRTQAQFAELSYVKSLGTGGDDEKPVFSLSRTGKNVVVLMLDRAISGYFPLLLEEKPFLKEQFSGFTFYPNTVSFGAHTIFGAPPLFGGYEYTPEEMNKRGSELLRDKHNESLLVMPALFSRSGWDVTVCDAPFANYKWVPDMSIYDSFPDIKTHVTERMYLKRLCEKYQLLDNGLQSLKRNFFCYSLFKVSPVFMQSFLYDDGDYYSSCDIAELFPKDFSKNPDALVFTKDFAKGYAVLDALCDATEIKDGGGEFIHHDVQQHDARAA